MTASKTATLPLDRIERAIETALAIVPDPYRTALSACLRNELMPRARRGRPSASRTDELVAKAMALHKENPDLWPRRVLDVAVTRDPREQRSVKNRLDKNWHKLAADYKIPELCN
jgi:hypothetical protein